MYEHIEVRPTDATLGARVYGIDLNGPLTSAAFSEIVSAWHAHAVLAFPGQHLDERRQIAFSRRFGLLERKIVDVKEIPDRNPEMDIISNVRQDGTLVEPGTAHAFFLEGDRYWHTDSSFKRIPAKASLLSARRVPAEGGDTEFADMRAAYDALDDTMKAWLSDKAAVHSLRYSQGLVGGLETLSEAELDALPPVVHPIIREHAPTGRKCLYIGRHASHIVGEDIETSRVLLRELCDQACRPPRVFGYCWGVGDLVIWDNRCVLHRGRGYPPDQARTVARTTVAGEHAVNEWAMAPPSDGATPRHP